MNETNPIVPPVVHDTTPSRRPLGNGPEVQPHAADATRLSADDRLPLPYICRADRPQEVREDSLGPFQPEPLLSYSTWNQYPAPSVNTPRLAAEYQAAAVRVAHTWNGPLTVYVWATREETEHYRAPVPPTAYVVEFGPITDDTACILPDLEGPGA